MVFIKILLPWKMQTFLKLKPKTLKKRVKCVCSGQERHLSQVLLCLVALSKLIILFCILQETFSRVEMENYLFQSTDEKIN